MAEDLQEKFSQNNAKFSLNLYSQVKKDNADKNIIISPFSIQTCVALAYAGAGGKTAEEISSGLHLIGNDKNVVGESFKNVLDLYKDSPLLKIANKFYVKVGYQVKDEFNTIATKYFYSEAENIQFEEKVEAAAKMNNWVEERTNNKIKNLIKPDVLDSLTRMILINAIHFKGEWQHKFKESATQKENFWISETESVKVDMMNTKKNFRYGEFDDLDATALEMPYKNSNLSMLILLPRRKTGLSNLEEKLQGISLTNITQNMFFNEVIVKFPKFKTEFEIELTNTFEKMGMGSMFSDDADFSNLLDSPEPLKVSQIVHKAFIEVNEEGAEAAAATAAVIRMKRSAPISKHFTVDHPFLYAIISRDSQHKFIVFYGCIKSFIKNMTDSAKTCSDCRDEL
ncbi:serine protease inhibitor 42Dd-like isoform X2 [Condylostylus longicornis]|nr:serine protease inhibitor 42Dd-like isoform X2 [Condylostylus longicornis]